MKASPSRTSQRGFTLVMTLIFLIIFMLFAISMVSSSMINTKVAANQQYRLEATTVAQQGIEQVLSQPFAQVPVPATSLAVDVNGDGKADYIARVASPVCIASKPVLNQDLDSTNPNDLGCMFSTSGQNTGILLPGGGSIPGPPCQATQWDVQSSVNDTNNTATAVTIHQGVSVRVLQGTTCP
jgi:Tfp pilus assembly protein PilX